MIEDEVKKKKNIFRFCASVPLRSIRCVCECIVVAPMTCRFYRINSYFAFRSRCCLCSMQLKLIRQHNNFTGNISATKPCTLRLPCRVRVVRNRRRRIFRVRFVENVSLLASVMPCQWVCCAAKTHNAQWNGRRLIRVRAHWQYVCVWACLLHY